MPSFDIVSEVDKHELANAVDQANREIANRFDFKGTDSTYELSNDAINLSTESDFQLKQMEEILNLRLSKRGIELGHLEESEAVIQLKSAKKSIKVKEGLNAEAAKKITKLIKDSKMKVQATIQGDQVRVTGKKRDDLQEAMTALRKVDVGAPLQFKNFRD